MDIHGAKAAAMKALAGSWIAQKKAIFRRKAMLPSDAPISVVATQEGVELHYQDGAVGSIKTTFSYET